MGPPNQHLGPLKVLTGGRLKIVTGIENFTNLHQDSISLCIGNFDGFHLGHRKLIAHSLKWMASIDTPSTTQSKKSWVLTFSPHPHQYFSNHVPFSRIFDTEDQVHWLNEWNFEGIIVQPFDENFSKISAKDFLETIIFRFINPKQIVVGADFRFGSQRKGDLTLLRKISQSYQCEVTVQELLYSDEYPEQKVSTSWIRQLLQSKEMEQSLPLVQKYLGRPYSLRGLVIHGDGRGKQIGFPTANLKPTVQFSPQKGVYATQTYWMGNAFQSLTNIGTNPTFMSENSIKIETHLLDFNHEIYGEIIQVEFLSYIRPEKKFSSVEELILQIHKDRQKAGLVHNEYQKK